MSDQNFTGTENAREIKYLIVLYAIFFAIALLSVAIILAAQADLFSYVSIVMLASVVVLPVIMVGILKRAKWGFYLAFAFSLFHLIDGLLGISIIKIAIHGIILYYLYKWMRAFK